MGKQNFDLSDADSNPLAVKEDKMIDINSVRTTTDRIKFILIKVYKP